MCEQLVQSYIDKAMALVLLLVQIEHKVYTSY